MHTRFVIAALALALSAAAQAPRAQVAVSLVFTEGPAVDAGGNVYFSETTNKRILKLAPDGKLSVFRENSNGANGLVFDARGRLVACERDRVTRTDMETGRIEVLAGNYRGKPLNGPNDVTFDGQGRLYFSDPAQPSGGAVYRIDPDGKLTRIIDAPKADKPNGVMISPGDRTLYLVESNGAEGGNRMIRAYDLQPDGSVANMRVFHNFYPGRSADGMVVDSRGNLYAAAGLHSRRGTSETLDTQCGIYVFSPAGEQLDFIPIPEDTVTNVAFGGPDLRTLYVTAGKTLFRIRTEIPGTRR